MFHLEILMNAVHFLLLRLSLNSKTYYLKFQSLYHLLFLLLLDFFYVVDYALLIEFHILLNEMALFLY